jgi:SAM-dependent methyltransferase
MIHMQKSLYQNETFANYWNERAGDSGEVYKRYVLDPLMLGLLGELKGKTIVELGCGNGYLAPKLLEQDPKQIVMMDISEFNLQHAARKTKDKRVSFLEQDATEPWKVETGTVDVVYSNMMLNEIEDIQAPIKEAFRVLRGGGAIVFSVTHPAWDLFMYAQEKAGVSSNKVRGLGGYFRRGFAKFVMGSGSKTAPELAGKYGAEFEVEHYQRPVSDYFNALVSTGFTVNRLLEPELNEDILRHAPRFSVYADNPIGLIFYCTKRA